MRPPPEKVSCVNWRRNFLPKYPVAPFSNLNFREPACVARESPSCARAGLPGRLPRESLPVCETQHLPSVRLNTTTRASSESWACATEEKKTRLDAVSKTHVRTILGNFILGPLSGRSLSAIRCGH